MEPKITDADFAALLGRTGIPLTSAQVMALREGYDFMAPMLERIRPPRGREAEPAHIFVPAIPR